MSQPLKTIVSTPTAPAAIGYVRPPICFNRNIYF